MREELNPGLRDTHRPHGHACAASTRGSPQPSSSSSNLGYADYNALQMSVHKRFSKSYQFRVSYTYSKADGIVGAAGATDTINTQTVDPVTRAVSLNLDRSVPVVGPGSSAHPVDGRIGGGAADEGPGRQRRLPVPERHAVHAHRQRDRPESQRQLRRAAAGRHLQRTGLEPGRDTVENKGGINGARGPTFSILNMRAGYRFRLPGNRALQAHVDVFNATNRANFNNPTAATAA